MLYIYIYILLLLDAPIRRFSAIDFDGTDVWDVDVWICVCGVDAHVFTKCTYLAAPYPPNRTHRVPNDEDGFLLFLLGGD